MFHIHILEKYNPGTKELSFFLVLDPSCQVTPPATAPVMSKTLNKSFQKKESNPQIMCLSGFNKCQSISAQDAKSPKKEAKLRDHSQPHTAGEMAV